MIQKPVLLFLNAGRRVELIQNVRAALQQSNVQGRIVTTDINNLAPALYLGDSQHILPRCSDPRFLDIFVDLCRSEQVDLVIPLIDPDLTVLSENREAIEQTGTRLLASNSQVIDICGNKINTNRFLEDNGFPTPRIFSQEDSLKQGYPLFLKPADGSASINAYKINNEQELVFFSKYVQNPIIQEFIEGDEITVDVFSDWDQQAIAAVPRRRLKVRAGEVSAGKIERNTVLESMAKKIANTLETVGPINVQAITLGNSIKVLEINPRFGGGFPLSMAGGLPGAKWVTQMALGQPIDQDNFQIDDGLSMLRFDDSTYLHLDG